MVFRNKRIMREQKRKTFAIKKASSVFKKLLEEQEIIKIQSLFHYRGA